MAAGLAVVAASLAATAPRDGARTELQAASAGQARSEDRKSNGEQASRMPSSRMVAAPVRISDAATARLLRPGDRVDVLATAIGHPHLRSGATQVVARRARVVEVPRVVGPGTLGSGSGDLGIDTDAGALVVLRVPRSTAVELLGAAATSRLAVTLC